MGKQAKTHKAFRLDVDTIALIEAYAEEQGTTHTKALEDLVRAGASADQGKREAVSAAALQEHISDLRKQLDAKDAQIEQLHTIASQAQQLHLIEAQKHLPAPEEDALQAEDADPVEAVDVDPEPEPVETHEETRAGTQDAPQPRGGFFSRLFSRR